MTKQAIVTYSITSHAQACSCASIKLSLPTPPPARRLAMIHEAAGAKRAALAAEEEEEEQQQAEEEEAAAASWRKKQKKQDKKKGRKEPAFKLDPSLLDNDFDPEAWDRQMAAAFNDDYYVRACVRARGACLLCSVAQHTRVLGGGGELLCCAVLCCALKHAYVEYAQAHSCCVRKGALP